MNLSFLFKYFLKFISICILLLINTVTAKIPRKSQNNSIKQTEPQPAVQEIQKPAAIPPENLQLLKNSYPDVIFEESFLEEADEWIITVKVPSKFSETGFRQKNFYWCNGSMLPESELENREKYWSLIYSYPEKLKDPADMTEEERQKLKEFGSRSNRRNGAGTPMFFFDLLYDANTQAQLEKNIITTTFLNHKTRIHQRIKAPLQRVENRILELARTDTEVKTFVEKIKSNDAYNWRLIDGTNRKSFHSYGIAVDILPVRITGEIYWSWARDKNPENWMLTPLKRRWLPPESVVKIFEEEGFIWGGKWAIWDNMHFEYHPELLIK